MVQILLYIVAQYEASPENYPPNSDACKIAEIDRECLVNGDISLEDLLSVSKILSTSIMPKR